MLIPPFFTEKGHHYPTILADILGFGFLFFGVLVGATIKSGIARNVKISIRDADLNLLVLAFVSIIYAVRIMLFSEVGIYAFLHPYSRASSLLDTVALSLSMPYIILLMTLIYTTRKKLYLILLICEVAFFIVPSMARSYYIMPFLYFFLILLYYGRFKFFARVKKIAPIIICSLIFIALVGPYINSVRSYVTIGKLEKGLDLEFALEEKKLDFLIDRLNVHGQSFEIEPVIEKAAKLDALAFKSMFAKFLGFSSGYEMNPTGVSTEVGQWIGYGAQTATDLPRNYVLLNYELGTLMLIAFNFLLGVLLAVMYKLIFKLKNPIFMTLWVPFVFSPAFGGQGAFPSAFVFQYIFVLCSFGLVFINFCLLKVGRGIYAGTISRARKGCCVIVSR